MTMMKKTKIIDKKESEDEVNRQVWYSIKNVEQMAPLNLIIEKL